MRKIEVLQAAIRRRCQDIEELVYELSEEQLRELNGRILDALTEVAPRPQRKAKWR